MLSVTGFTRKVIYYAEIRANPHTYMNTDLLGQQETRPVNQSDVIIVADAARRRRRSRCSFKRRI
jgi:hypothetical protein